MLDSASTAPCSKRHKVLVLDNTFDMGGLEKKLFDFISRIDKNHFDVVICCLKEGGYFKNVFEEMGVTFYEKILRHKYDVTSYTHFSRILEAEKVELIYSFLHPNTVFFSYAAKELERVKGWIVSVHATGSSTGGKLVRPYLKPFLNRVDRIIAVAQAHKEYLISNENLDEQRIDVIYNGVDIDTYQQAKPDPAIVSELGLEKNIPIITTVASLKPLKRIDLFLRNAQEILKHVPQARFLIVGDGPERESLVDLANQLGLGNRAVFTGIRSDVHNILRLSSVFVLSSSTEAFPNVILEAMASGVPVVSTDVGSVRELVEDGVSGVVVPPDDEYAIAGAVTALLTDKARMTLFSKRGREIVEQKFTLERMCKQRESLFSELLCNQK